MSKECQRIDPLLMNQEAANDEVKPNIEKGPEKVPAEQDMVLEGEAETKTEVGTSSQWPSNRTDHPLSPDKG
jgi:hypothetical protein